MKRFVIFLVLALLLVVALPALAQDRIAVEDIPTWQQFLTDSAGVFVTLGVVLAYPSTILVSIIKALFGRFWQEGLKYIEPIAFITPLILGGLYWTVDYFGFGEAFINTGNMLLMIAPVVLGWAGILVGQTVAYRVNKKLGTATAGTSTADIDKG